MGIISWFKNFLGIAEETSREQFVLETHLENIDYSQERKHRSMNKKDTDNLHKRPPVPETCSICDSELNLANLFHCKYCNKYYCSEHRLPEKHKCKNASKPKGFTSGRIVYKADGTTSYYSK